MTVRVLIVDDQALVRAGFRKLLELDAAIEVVGEAGEGGEAVELALRHSPDVVLMDIRMPGIDGLEATRRLAEAGSKARVLILTTFGINDYVYEALRAGASGFLLKDAPAEELLAGVHVVARGDALLDPSVTRSVIEEFARRPVRRHELVQRLEELTPRERDVLALLVRGLSIEEIAHRLRRGHREVRDKIAEVGQACR